MSQSIKAGELSNVGLSIVLRTKCVKVKKIFGGKPTLLILMYSKGTFFLILTACLRVVLKTLPRNTQVPLQCCIKRCSLKGKLRLRVNLFIRPSMPLFGCVGTLMINPRYYEV